MSRASPSTAMPVDFSDAATYYRVSTVNYLAAGACNFSDAGKSLWPLDQIVADTQYYVRDAVIEYVQAVHTVSPAVEGRLQFLAPATTVPALADEVNDLYELRLISSASVRDGLLSKLATLGPSTKPKTASNVLKAFIHLVQAQSGKSITAPAAAYLIADAQYLIAHL